MKHRPNAIIKLFINIFISKLPKIFLLFLCIIYSVQKPVLNYITTKVLNICHIGERWKIRKEENKTKVKIRNYADESKYILKGMGVHLEEEDVEEN